MISIPLKDKVSRQHVEFLLTILTAFFIVRVYKRDPLLMSASLIGVVVALPLLLKKTEYLILPLAAILPFRDIHIFSLLYLKRGLVWGILAAVILREFGQSKRVFSRNMEVFTRVAVFFLASLAISLIQSATALGTTRLVTSETLRAVFFFYALTLLDEIIMLYLVYCSLKTVQHVRFLLDVMLAVSACIAVLGVWQYYHGGTPAVVDFLFDPDFRFYGRATSVFSNPNELGIFLSSMTVIAFTSAIWELSCRWKKIFFYFPVLLAILGGLILSFSRGAIVQLFLSLLVVVYIYYTKLARKRFSWKTIVFALLIITIIVSAGSLYDSYMRARLSAYQGNSFHKALYQTRAVSDSLRKDVAVRAIKTFIEHPFLGIGYELFWRTRVTDFLGLSPHNQYLKILAEMGLAGFVPFVGMLFVVLKTGMSIWKKDREEQTEQPVQISMFVLLSGMSSVIFGFLFIDSLTVVAVSGYLWFFSGAILALERECCVNPVPPSPIST